MVCFDACTANVDQGKRICCEDRGTNFGHIIGLGGKREYVLRAHMGNITAVDHHSDLDPLQLLYDVEY